MFFAYRLFSSETVGVSGRGVGIIFSGIEVKVRPNEASSTSNNSIISGSNLSVVVFAGVPQDLSICFAHAKFLFSDCRHFCQ